MDKDHTILSAVLAYAWEMPAFPEENLLIVNRGFWNLESDCAM